MANKLEEYWCNLNTHGETECKPANLLLLYLFSLIFQQPIANGSTARSREKSIADVDIDVSPSLVGETRAKRKKYGAKTGPAGSEQRRWSCYWAEAQIVEEHGSRTCMLQAQAFDHGWTADSRDCTLSSFRVK